MSNEEAKKELIDFLYEIDFYNEKCKEIESMRGRVKKITESAKTAVGCEDNLFKLIDRQTEEEFALIKIYDKKKKLEEKIDQLGQPHKNVLYFRYILRLNYDQIADRMNYSVKRIYQLHSEAIKMYVKLSS